MSSLPANTGNIIGAMGSLVSGVGQLMGAGEEREVGDYNAKVLEQRSQAERASNTLLEYQKRKTLKARVGTQVSLYAKSGIKMTGSPIEVLTDGIANAEMDIAIDKYNSEVAARGYGSQADMTRYEASRRSSVSTAGASSTFLSTASRLFQSQQKIGGTNTKLGDSPYGTMDTPTGTISLLPRTK